jgi:hypothetical protein
MAGAETETIEVEVACDTESGVQLFSVTLPAGSTVGDAIRAANLAGRLPGVDLSTRKTGIFGKLRERIDVVQDGDRVEIYLPLVADPKEARRRRAAHQRE